MNEILQKRIEEKSKELGQMFFPDNMNVFARPNWEAGYIETACKEIANFALQNQWISVEEALPTLDEKYDFSERYLVKTNEGAIKVMRIFKNIAWCDIFDGRAFIPFEKKIVTHWMKIPNEGGEE